MCEDSSPRKILSLLGDEHVQTILAVTSEQSMSANELSDTCGISLPTVYRRIQELVEYDLLSEQNKIAPDGNHYKKYEAAVERIDVQLQQGTFAVNIEEQPPTDAPDRFNRLWSDIRRDDS
ncbi:helix-turn-helix domain-containing protein [Haladaptatus sp. R4]|uniref:ArsR/SmtB family transcription factor n=1 Tax=Haladaptatus sp. R4 TaxID=1679489 RepID=UPI001CBFF4A4|nr:helix-turn-helix domain-containing protein [Haladaptatus sp. R4]